MPFFRGTHQYGASQSELSCEESSERLESDEERDARRRADVTDEVINQLRADGLSWTVIARRTGLSRSGARQRWLAINGVPRARERG
jgi:hypothetical protein